MPVPLGRAFLTRCATRFRVRLIPARTSCPVPYVNPNLSAMRLSTRNALDEALPGHPRCSGKFAHRRARF